MWRAPWRVVRQAELLIPQARAEEARRRNASKLFAVGESRLFLEAQVRPPSHGAKSKGYPSFGPTAGPYM
jgi:hypothetical protein